MFTETPFVADERQTPLVTRESVRTPPLYRIAECGGGDPRRGDAEDFIRRRFLRSHGAHVATFMPTLLLLIDPRDELAAVAGFRGASDEPLFLERYLRTPIEKAISSQASAPVRREEIIEVGNFAALDSRRAKIFMSFMPAWFLECSARWIVFTATAAIRGIVTAMGGRCIEVGRADGACAAGGADEWGRYYENDPRVMAGFLPSARRIPALWRTHHGD